MEKVWNSVHPISVQFVRSEFSPQFASIVPPTDLVLTIPFALEMDQFTGLITFCIPYSTLDPIKNKLYSGYQADNLAEADHFWVERLVEQLKRTEVEVVVEFGKIFVPAQRLLNLKVGEVLPLGKDVSEQIVGRVQGIPKLLGKAGIYGSNKAFQIGEKNKSQ
jgi:flagellar motor switch protein FliM